MTATLEKRCLQGGPLGAKATISLAICCQLDHAEKFYDDKYLRMTNIQYSSSKLFCLIHKSSPLATRLALTALATAVLILLVQ